MKEYTNRQVIMISEQQIENISKLSAEDQLIIFRQILKNLGLDNIFSYFSQKVKNNFVKPPIEEIKVYCIERKNNIDPEIFFNHYEANGWMIGKTKMKNWKAAIRNWEKTGKKINETEKRFKGTSEW